MILTTEQNARRQVTLILLLVMAIVLLFFLSLAHGSVSIPVGEVGRILLGDEGSASWRFIILETRLPQALTAWLAGGALAASGLLLQTAFGNPLAAPDIFGVTSGASLAVALLTLAPVATLPVALGYLSSVAAAFVGAIAVTALIFAVSRWVHSPVVLMVVGIMVGYLASSAITLLNFFATEQGVKNFAVWGMGNFGNVPMDVMPVFAPLTLRTWASMSSRSGANSSCSPVCSRLWSPLSVAPSPSSHSPCPTSPVCWRVRPTIACCSWSRCLRDRPWRCSATC